MTRSERQLRAALLKNVGWRERLEVALPLRLWFTVAANCLSRDVFEHGPVQALQAAIYEHVPPAPSGKRPGGQVQAMDLLNWLNQDLLWPLESANRAKVIAALTHFTNALVEGGWLVLPDEHPALEVMAALVEAVNETQAPGETRSLADVVDRSARRTADRMLARCQSMGLYKPAAEVAA